MRQSWRWESWRRLPTPLQPILCCGQKLRTAGEIPVGIVNLDVAEVGGEDRQPPLDVLTVVVPAHKGLHGKSVSKIMHARMSLAFLADQTKLIGHAPEHSVYGIASDLRPPPIDEPVWNLPARQEAGPPFLVIGQGRHSGKVQRNHSGLSEFGGTDGQDAVGQIDIVQREIDRLGNTQPGDTEQAEKAV